MLWVFLGELQWGSRYHGANEHATAREPLNYGTEEQLITTSVIGCGNKFSLKLSRETSTYRSVGGGIKRRLGVARLNITVKARSGPRGLWTSLAKENPDD